MRALRRLSTLTVVAVVLAVPAEAAAGQLAVRLPLQSAHTVLVDAPDGLVFVSGPSPKGTSSLVAVNTDGTLKAVVGDEEGLVAWPLRAEALRAAVQPDPGAVRPGSRRRLR